MADNPADLDLVEAVAALSDRSLSSRELVDACLRRIDERDGPHSFDGTPDAVNAWVRVYADEARVRADAADVRRAAAARAGDAVPPMCGVPVGLKDLIGAAGHPLTGSSRVVDVVPDADSVAWAALRDQGAVLLGHLHTHELGAGGSTDQVGNPFALERSPGGSSGGNAAALVTRTVPATLGTDSAGSLRIPSGCCGTSGLKPTYEPLDSRGVTPLSASLTGIGPMARTVADCAVVYAALSGSDAPGATDAPLHGLRVAVHPRSRRVQLHPDVAAGLDRAVDALRQAGARLVAPPEPPAEDSVAADASTVLMHELRAAQAPYADRHHLYRPSTQELIARADERAVTPDEHRAALARRAEDCSRWAAWFYDEGVDVLLEPAIPIPTPLRGHGYDSFFTDEGGALVALTRLWNWTGLPALAMPAGLDSTGVPVSVSLVGPAGSDWRLLDAGAALQAALGVPAPPGVSA
jgi:aspartyl-tRNA(Asn)/glutamyl-tRNA(Gln) amidotransferase subunit A